MKLYTKVKKCLIGVLSVTSIVPLMFIAPNISAYANSSLAGGNNTEFGGASISSNTAGSGILFHTKDDNGYEFSSCYGSNVIGARITAYSTGNEEIIQGAKNKTGTELTTYLHSNLNKFTMVNLNDNPNYTDSVNIYRDGCSNFITYDSAFLLNPWSVVNGNAPIWLTESSSGTPVMKGCWLYQVANNNSVSGLNDTLYNGEI